MISTLLRRYRAIRARAKHILLTGLFFTGNALADLPPIEQPTTGGGGGTYNIMMVTQKWAVSHSDCLSAWEHFWPWRMLSSRLSMISAREKAPGRNSCFTVWWASFLSL